MKILFKNKKWKINEDYDIDKILYLLIDRPNYINMYNYFHWHNNKVQFHRDYDLPAVIGNGHVEWNKNNKLHRENNKPDIICQGGMIEFRK